MPVERSRIRVKAFAVIFDGPGEHHLVARMSTTEHPVFHRPLGGSIELGERSREAVIREIGEELGATLVDPELLGVLENIFTIEGELGHEVVFVYVGRLAEPDVVPPAGRSFVDTDEHGAPGDEGWVEWRPVSGDPAIPLFPDGLQELLVPAERPPYQPAQRAPE